MSLICQEFEYPGGPTVWSHLAKREKKLLLIFPSVLFCRTIINSVSVVLFYSGCVLPYASYRLSVSRNYRKSWKNRRRRPTWLWWTMRSLTFSNSLLSPSHQYATLAALEQVVNVSREKGDDRASKYMVILRQWRPLGNSGAFQSILTKLVASKKESEVAKVVEKALKNSPPFHPGWNAPPYLAYPFPRGRRGGSQTPRPKSTIKCYACGQFGHITRFCVKGPSYWTVWVVLVSCGMYWS